MTRPLPFLALSLLLASPARADRVITEDGRILSPQKAREHETGYRFVFEHGEIVVPTREGVQAVEIEGDMSDYVPKDENERKKLADGYVRFGGKWMSKPAYEEELRKAHEASRARLELLAEHSPWHNAWEQETKHFVVRTNTSPEILDYYCDLLEAYYGLMDDRIGIKPTPRYRKIKMTVNIYRSYEDFQKLAEPGSPSVLGFFHPYKQTLNFFHDYTEPERSDWVGLHECTHLLTFLIDQQYMAQIWLNEAVADYFGSADITRDKRGRLVIEPGKLQRDRVLTVQQAIEKGNDVKLEDLFLLEKKDFHGFEYAHAWSFVYFLNNYESGKYAKGFAKFFKGLYTLEKGIPFESVAGGSLNGTGKRVPPEDIRAYLLKRIKVKDVEKLEAEWKQFVADIPIEGPEARLKRGIRTLRSGGYERAMEDLDAAIDGGTEDPRAWASRAKARAVKGDLAGAVEDLQIAIEKAPLNAGFRYELALYRLGEVPNVVSEEDVKIVVENVDFLDEDDARRQAGLAMELDPENDRYRDLYNRFD